MSGETPLVGTTTTTAAISRKGTEAKDGRVHDSGNTVVASPVDDVQILARAAASAGAGDTSVLADSTPASKPAPVAAQAAAPPAQQPSPHATLTVLDAEPVPLLRQEYTPPTVTSQDHANVMEHLANSEGGYTAVHMNMVANYASNLANWLTLQKNPLALRPEQLVQLNRAAAVYDAGKTAIDQKIWNDPRGPKDMSKEEWGQMWGQICRHVAISTDASRAAGKPIDSAVEKAILAAACGNLSDAERAIIRHHHENSDGSGYTDKMQGTQVPIGAQILRICDSFDALTNPRSSRFAADEGAAKQPGSAGRPAKSYDEARAILEKDAQAGKINKELLAAFFEHVVPSETELARRLKERDRLADLLHEVAAGTPQAEVAAPSPPAVKDASPQPAAKVAPQQPPVAPELADTLLNTGLKIFLISAQTAPKAFQAAFSMIDNVVGAKGQGKPHEEQSLMFVNETMQHLPAWIKLGQDKVQPQPGWTQAEQDLVGALNTPEGLAFAENLHKDGATLQQLHQQIQVDAVADAAAVAANPMHGRAAKRQALDIINQNSKTYSLARSPLDMPQLGYGEATGRLLHLLHYFSADHTSDPAVKNAPEMQTCQEIGADIKRYQQAATAAFNAAPRDTRNPYVFYLQDAITRDQQMAVDGDSKGKPLGPKWPFLFVAGRQAVGPIPGRQAELVKQIDAAGDAAMGALQASSPAEMAAFKKESAARLAAAEAKNGKLSLGQQLKEVAETLIALHQGGQINEGVGKKAQAWLDLQNQEAQVHTAGMES